MKIQVWFAVDTTTNTVILQGNRISRQVFRDAPPTVSGGRFARFATYDRDNKLTGEQFFSAWYRSELIES